MAMRYAKAYVATKFLDETRIDPLGLLDDLDSNERAVRRIGSPVIKLLHTHTHTHTHTHLYTLYFAYLTS